MATGTSVTTNKIRIIRLTKKETINYFSIDNQRFTRIVKRINAAKSLSKRVKYLSIRDKPVSPLRVFFVLGYRLSMRQSTASYIIDSIEGRGRTPNDTLMEKDKTVIRFCKKPRSAEEIMNKLGLKNVGPNRRRYITRLVSMGLLAKTIPGKATSQNQKYIAI